MTPASVRITRNFDRNLEAVREFLVELGSPAAFGQLLDELFDDIIPALAEFPDLGADVFRHPERSREVRARTARLRRRLGPDTGLRELVRGDFLLLYVRRKREVFLLAIRHHRQLSFDLLEHWPV
jgi:plasmid stabilization system protein ParE